MSEHSRTERQLAARLEIVHEDERLLVLNKPADLVCHPTKTDAWSSLIGRVRLYLRDDATVHMVNRLDRETSGLVLVAKTDAFALALRRRWESRAVAKEYQAIVHGWPSADEGLIDEPLGRDEASRVAIKDCVRADGASSETAFAVERRFLRSEGRFALLTVTPRTGRKHQIRIHLAHIAHPVVGDKLYGHDEECYLALVESRLTAEQRQRLLLPNHALHAGRLRFEIAGEAHEYVAGPDEAFRRFCAEGIGA
ncbi:MAG TPA: RNA pseudouridine synthase [Verrucomicrobiales bacterium]|nr:RNA pseudouridine synthase [Verrucomicrobiales bacterium]